MRGRAHEDGVVWYVVAGVLYVVVATFNHQLLNWLVGPLWLVAVVWAGPALVKRFGGDRAR